MQPTAEPAVSFAKPMKAAAAALGDEPDSWDAGYKGADIDGLLILAMGKEKGVFDADAIPTALLDAVKNAHGQMEGSATVAALEIGQQQRRGEEAVEHFGYVDGISQPIMTVPDLPPANQRQHNDPSAGPGLALVRGPVRRRRGCLWQLLRLPQARAERQSLAGAGGGPLQGSWRYRRGSRRSPTSSAGSKTARRWCSRPPHRA